MHHALLQDNPLMGVARTRGSPLLGLDVWEHAYYLVSKVENKNKKMRRAGVLPGGSGRGNRGSGQAAVSWYCLDTQLV